MTRRGLLGCLPLLQMVVMLPADEPEEAKPNVHGVTLRVEGTVAQGVEAKGTAEVQITGAKDIGTAMEAAERALRVMPVEVIGAKKVGSGW